jgi:hypothetical protein
MSKPAGAPYMFTFLITYMQLIRSGNRLDCTTKDWHASFLHCVQYDVREELEAHIDNYITLTNFDMMPIR